jgi:hypothetical protein
MGERGLFALWVLWGRDEVRYKPGAVRCTRFEVDMLFLVWRFVPSHKQGMAASFRVMKKMYCILQVN